MFAARKTIDKKTLQELVPLNALSTERFSEVADKIIVEEVKAGRYLFRKGDRDNQSIYVLEGKVNLIDGRRKVTGEVEAGTDMGRYPIANQQPRPLSARAVKKVVIARIDSSLLDAFMTWDQGSSQEAVEIAADDNEDWMTRMLQSDVFERIPPQMIQSLLMRMQSFPVKAGDVVIGQGDEGDYFYTIHEGRCAVTRRASPDEQAVKLAELSEGHCFGDEALVSDTRRNATVSMLTDGLLMRLAKKDFVEFLHKPLVRKVAYKEAAGMVEDAAVWLDVRTAKQHEAGSIEDSVNIPLSDLRGEISELVFNAKYVIYCDNGGRSDSAAFILSHKGFDVYVLDGGIVALTPDEVKHSGLPEGAEEISGPREGLAEVIEFDAGKAAPASVKNEEVDSRPPAHTVDDESRLTELQQGLASLQKQNQVLQDELRGLQSDKARLDEQLDQARAELGESGEKLEDLYSRSRSAADDKQLLQDKYSALQQEYQEKTGTLSRDLEQARKQADGLNAEQMATKLELDKFRKSVNADSQTQADEHARLGDELEQAHKQSLQLQAELDAASEAGEAARQKATAGLEQQREQTAVLQQQLAAAQEQLEAGDADQQHILQKIDGLQKENDELRQQLENSSGELKTGSLELEKLGLENEQGRQQLSAMTKDYEASREEVLKHQQEVEQLRDQQNQLEKNLEEHKQQVANLAEDKQAAVKALEQQQTEWNAERQTVEQDRESAQQVIDKLNEQIQELHANGSDARARHEEQLNEQIGQSNQQLERLETRFAELGQQKSELSTKYDELVAEHELLTTRLNTATGNETGLQQKVDSLTEQVSSLTDTADVRIRELEAQLEEEQQQGVAKDEALEALRSEMSNKDEASTTVDRELSELRDQEKQLREEIGRQQENEKARETENAELVRKMHEDLARKNEDEKELSGQVDRLRKKLEQVTADIQQVRTDAQQDLENAREELHRERKARSDERAEMAARQRELKEQLSSVASEHEEKLSRQSGEIEQARDAGREEERARLQDVLDMQADSERQIAVLREELKQAHAEIASMDEKGKDQRQAGQQLVDEQKQQSETTISELETRLQKVTDERDAVLEEQQVLRDSANALRGEIEVARGLMTVNGDELVEDPPQLRAELDEVRKNLEIAVRLRAEAETARDSLVEERDALLVQVDNKLVLGEPLNERPDTHEPITGLDTVGAIQENISAKSVAAGENVSGKRPFRDIAGLESVGRSWLGRGIGLGVVLLGALVGWLVLGPGVPVSVDTVNEQPASPARQVIEPAPHAQVPVESVPQPQEARTVQGEKPLTMPAKPVKETVQVSTLRTFSDNLKKGTNGPVMVELPGGGYLMGSTGNSLNYEEGPQHKVTLSGFSISKHEVTFKEYDRFARATGRRLPHDEGWGRGDQPVVNVSWKDARAYTSWLSRQTGQNYRLPTEAEWEYAARAGTASAYWWPRKPDTVHANCFNCGSKWDNRRTAVVGSFSANSFGLHDTSGNVHEWIEDCYHAGYSGLPTDGAAWLTPECTQRVVRGGAYTSPMDSVRNARRGQYDQDTRLDNMGFRVVRSN